MEVLIEFAVDPSTGRKPVLDHLNALVALAKANDEAALWILPRIRRALDFVNRHGVPDSVGKVFSDTDDRGMAYTLANPVKVLTHHAPIHELRINRQGYGAFRALFFPHEFDGSQFIVFTRSVVKSTKSDPAFHAAVAATAAMLPDFMREPRKYISLERK